MTNRAWSLEGLRADVAEILKEDPAGIGDEDNLMDFGLDSIRLMFLTQRWSDAGARIEFSELAEWPELRTWWRLIESRLTPST